MKKKSKKKLKKEEGHSVSSEIGCISYDILDNIISPITKSSGIIANLYLADIGCYAVGDQKEIDEIIKTIKKKYKLSKDMAGMIDEHMPIALIALMVLEKENPRLVYDDE